MVHWVKNLVYLVAAFQWKMHYLTSWGFLCFRNFVNLFFPFASWPHHSSQSSAAWKAAAHVHSQPVNWRRCFPRPSCINTMSEKRRRKLLQPMPMSLSGEFSGSWAVICQLPIRKLFLAASVDENSITEPCLQVFWHVLLWNKRTVVFMEKSAVETCIDIWLIGIVRVYWVRGKVACVRSSQKGMFIERFALSQDPEWHLRFLVRASTKESFSSCLNEK